MSIKSCADCGYKVSSRAKSCPKCGRVNPGGIAPLYRAAQMLVILGGVLFTGGLINYSLNPPNSMHSQFEYLDQIAKDGITQLNSHP